MTRQEWLHHWRTAGPHQIADCPACAQRRKTIRKQTAAKRKDDALRSLGLKKVKGALGGTYWE